MVFLGGGALSHERGTPVRGYNSANEEVLATLFYANRIGLDAVCVKAHPLFFTLVTGSKGL